MAVKFDKLTGNNTIFEAWEGILTEIMTDTDGKASKDDEVLKKLFAIKKSRKAAEGRSGLTEFGDFVEVVSGSPGVNDEIKEGFAKKVEHHTFIKAFSIDQEMIEDGRINDARLAAKNFIRSYKRSKLKFATAALTTEGGSFVYGGKTYDKTTGDKKGLFAVDHPGIRDGVPVQSNIFTNELGTDATVLYTLANYGENFLNTSGELAAYPFDTLVIPGNRPNLKETALRLIRSHQVVGSANNDVNTQFGEWELVVNHRWNAPVGSDPYILLSREYLREMEPAVFYNRVDLTVKNTTDFDTWVQKWSGRARFSCVFYDWRFAILGGAAQGTTLSL